MPSVKDLEDAVRRRECVLFLGAGVHYPPPEDLSYVYPLEQRPPLGAAFSRQLADDCIATLDAERNGNEREKKLSYLRQHRDNLSRTSWYYDLHRGRGKLVEKITAAVETGKQPSPVVRALAEMDFPIIISTNYDRLFEKALRRLGKEPVIRIYDPVGLQWTKDFPASPNPPNPQTPWLFKMHGCVSELNSIVVTDEDYIRFVMRMGDSPDYHPMPERLRVKFKEWPTLFVGYSLLDYNLRLLFRTLRRRVDPPERPSTFSLDPAPDLLVMATYGSRVEEGVAGPLVSFITQDSWRFVPEFYQLVLGRPMPP